MIHVDEWTFVKLCAPSLKIHVTISLEGILALLGSAIATAGEDGIVKA